MDIQSGAMHYMLTQAGQLDRIRTLGEEWQANTIDATRFSTRVMQILSEPLPADIQKFLDDCDKVITDSTAPNK